MKRAYELTVVRTNIAEPSDTLDRAGAVARFCADLTACDREHLVRLDLDCRCRLVARETVFVGTVDTIVVSPREIFRGALLSGGRRIIVVHNHPSGDPSPSDEDLTVARNLEKIGELMDMPLADFIVVGDGGRYWSWSTRSEGRL